MLENLFANKSFTVTTFNINNSNDLIIINNIRLSQLQQIKNIADNLSILHSNIIILGDFNCSIEVNNDNYTYICWNGVKMHFMNHILMINGNVN